MENIILSLFLSCSIVIHYMTIIYWNIYKKYIMLIKGAKDEAFLAGSGYP